jgi:rare lipoprotein A
LALIVAGCGTSPPIRTRHPTPSLPPPGPIPAEIDNIPDPVPRNEPKSARGNPPFYNVLGKRYFVLNTADGYQERGVASWYGPGFHGRDTANGEVYDQNDMTAAHRTLPMPSLVQVTNLENGRSIRVRVNDRGPYAHGRIIDLSKRSAELLGITQQGTAKVRVQILALESRELAMAAGGNVDPYAPAPPAVPVETVAVQELPPVGGALVQTATRVPEPVPAPVRRRTVTQASPEPVVTQQRVHQTAIYVQAGAFAQVANAVRLRARLSSLGEVQIAKALVGESSYYRVRLGPMATVEQADRTLEILLKNGYNDARVVVD